MPAVSKSWKRQENGLPSGVSRLLSPTNCLISSPLRPHLGIWPPELLDNQFMLLQVTKFAVICYNSSREHIITKWEQEMWEIWVWYDTIVKYWIWEKKSRTSATLTFLLMMCKYGYSKPRYKIPAPPQKNPKMFKRKKMHQYLETTY